MTTTLYQHYTTKNYQKKIYLKPGQSCTQFGNCPARLDLLWTTVV